MSTYRGDYFLVKAKQTNSDLYDITISYSNNIYNNQSYLINPHGNFENISNIFRIHELLSNDADRPQFLLNIDNSFAEDRSESLESQPTFSALLR